MDRSEVGVLQTAPPGTCSGLSAATPSQLCFTLTAIAAPSVPLKASAAAHGCLMLLPCLQDQVYPPSEITQMMSQCDYVVCCTPYTPETHHLVSAAAIAAMKPNAVFINVGRGKCVDEEALIQGGVP